MGNTALWSPRDREVPSAEGMDRLPQRGERLVRSGDAKRFEVATITTIEGGERHFVLRAAGGERVFLCAEDFFPTHGPFPFRFDA